MVVAEMEIVLASREKLIDLILERGTNVVECVDLGCLLAGSVRSRAGWVSQSVLPFGEWRIDHVAWVGNSVFEQRVLDRLSSIGTTDLDRGGSDHLWNSITSVRWGGGPVPVRPSHSLRSVLHFRP